MRTLVCPRIEGGIAIDGDLEKPCWRRAPRSESFVDLVSGAPAPWATRVAALWDDDNFYAAYWVEEPHVRAGLVARDSLIYNENDVELFVAGEDCYYEFEINARGTIYEVFYIWQDALKKGGRFDVHEFDLLERRVDVLGGFQDGLRFGRHPRGARWAFRDWDFPGLRAAVRVDGTLNDDTDIDRGWTVELALPWRGMSWLAGERPLPPRDGDVWRMDFSRFERLEIDGREVDPHPGWALDAHGVYDSHLPEKFSAVRFSGERA